jgi:hypothetical protein
LGLNFILLPEIMQNKIKINPAKINRYATDKRGSTVPS